MNKSPDQDRTVDVLVVGAGPGGLTAATALARAGVDVVAISKHSTLSPTPRAHVTNQRTFEILRDFGVEDEAMALATPYAQMPGVVFCRSLAGDEYLRLRGLGQSDQELANRHAASPCAIADLPQHLLEPVLCRAATRAGAEVRLDTEFVDLEERTDGVRARLRDTASGAMHSVSARYVVGADGGSSRIAEQLGLPFEGEFDIGGSLNILFECDLTAHVAHRPALLYFLVRTAEDAGGAGLGFLRTIKPWTSWMLTQGYAAGQTAPSLSEAQAIAAVRDFLGLPELAPRITGTDAWRMHAAYATRYDSGRVYCVGDAVHRHVPSNGLGSNTAIQDAYNLSWKLALVVKGLADERLLGTYSVERAPIGRRTVERATASFESYGPLLDTLGGVDASSAGQGRRNLAQLAQSTPDGRRRRAAVRKASAAKVYEFRARGFELNQHCTSSAVLAEGRTPEPTSLDLELFHRPTSCPGYRLPHAWIQREGRDLSTLDLIGDGAFTLLTGHGGEMWIEASGAAADALGLPLTAHLIGAGGVLTDLYGDWAVRREVDEDGCLLVRPDGVVAWRRRSAVHPRQATQLLTETLRAIIGFGATAH